MISKVMANYKSVTFKQLQIIKLIFYGTPRAGKSTLRKQLLRHVEGFKLQQCGHIVPSTNIAEICDPIVVERILMTNEKNNEWKWTVQRLDDIAKALLRCLGNSQLQHVIKSSGPLITSRNMTSIENNVQQKPVAEPQKIAEPLAVQDMDTAPSPGVQNKTSDPIHATAVIESSPITDVANVDINVEELFLNAVQTGEWKDIVSALNIDNATFLQIIDGGGQPSFQEIFPLLISGPSLTVLVFKLTDELEKLYPVLYQPDDGTGESKAWKDYYIVKDIITHALASFVSQKDTPPLQCKMLLVGTHKDKLDKEGGIEAKINKLAEDLYGLLQQFKAYESIEVKTRNTLITPIDNSDEQDIVSVKTKIEKMISQLDSKDIPAPWLVFDFVLRKHAKQKELRKLEKRDCIDIARRCGVQDEDVDAVLQYLHFKAGTLLYYSDIPKLDQCVIIDFQLIFDSISKIIIQFFDVNSDCGAHLKHKNLLKQKGQLDASVLKDVQGCLTVDELISLLHHRHIISNMEGTNTFFMPSVLPKDKLSYNQSSNSSSFLVLFDHGYSPVGLFCAATTRLIVEHKWELDKRVDPFRNKINFYCKCSGKSYNVMFSAFSAHYEVCLVKKDPQDYSCVKYKIYQDVSEAFAVVCKHMQYPSPSYGFYCPETCECGDVSYLQYQHPAMCTFDCESQEMKCCYSGSPSDLSMEHKQWFRPPQVRVTNAWLIFMFFYVNMCFLMFKSNFNKLIF